MANDKPSCPDVPLCAPTLTSAYWLLVTWLLSCIFLSLVFFTLPLWIQGYT
jgi:hypothetical protein